MKKGFYLLCDLGVPYDDKATKPGHFKVNLPSTDFSVRSIFLINNKRFTQSSMHDFTNGRFIFWFKNSARDDDKAQRISDALLANIELIYQTAVVPTGESPLAYWLDNNVLYENYFLRYDQFKKDIPNLYFRLDYSVTLPRSIVKNAWDMLPITLYQPYFDAVHFYQASIREYCFIGDAITEVLNGYITSPVSRLDFVRAENAVVNAFKAIEAIIGDPPKNESKLRKKFEEIGIDPDGLVGFTGHNGSQGLEPLIKKIRKFSYLRDKKAAHGRSAIDRRIKYFEIMDLQACTQALIESAINFRKKQNAT